MSDSRQREPKLQAFGRFLRELRAGRSREQISRKLAQMGTPLDESTLVQYEKGTVWAPDVAVLSSLAAIYEQSLSAFAELITLNRNAPYAESVSDLLRHRGEERSNILPPSGGAHDPAQARLRELEARVEQLEAYEHIVRVLRPVLADAITLLGAEGGDARQAETPRRRRNRKAGR